MNSTKKGIAAVAVILAMALSASVATAQIDREKTFFALTEPTEFGNRVVPPGSYMIKVVPLSYNRNLVQVTSRDGMKVFAAALATPHPKKDNEPVPNAMFVYFPSEPGKPRAIRTWFAADTPYGQDIVYPRKRAQELALAGKTDVISIPEETAEAEYPTVTYTTVTREGTETTYTEPKMPETTVARTDQPASLPRTASPLALYALLGAGALASALGVRRTRKS